MERPVFQPVGTAVQDLDTPALVVELDVMERNIEVLHSYFRQSGAKLRPNLAAHQCPQIGHRQLEAGGTVGGVAVTTIGEAEVFNNAGFTDILVTNQVVTRSKIIRLCTLAKSSNLSVAVDNGDNIDDLSKAASASGVTLQVLVEVDAGLGRSGVLPGQPPGPEKGSVMELRCRVQIHAKRFLRARRGEKHRLGFVPRTQSSPTKSDAQERLEVSSRC